MKISPKVIGLFLPALIISWIAIQIQLSKHFVDSAITVVNDAGYNHKIDSVILYWEGSQDTKISTVEFTSISGHGSRTIRAREFPTQTLKSILIRCDGTAGDKERENKIEVNQTIPTFGRHWIIIIDSRLNVKFRDIPIEQK